MNSPLPSRNKPFLICGYPRSRTAWLAALYEIPHEPSIDWKDYSQALAFYQAGGAASDPMQTLLAGRLLDDVPEIEVIIILRPKAECAASARRLLEYEYFGQQMNKIEAEINSIMDRDRVTVFPYHCLGKETCRAIWNLVGSPGGWDEDRYDALAPVNIQLNLSRHRERVEANREWIRALYKGE